MDKELKVIINDWLKSWNEKTQIYIPVYIAA